MKIFIGIGMLIWSLFLGLSAYHLKQDGIHTQGQVVEVLDARCKDRSQQMYHSYNCYYPVISFSDNAGGDFTFKGNHRTHKYHVGQEIGVVYLPDDPAHTAIVDDAKPWTTALSVGFIGTLFILSGFLDLPRNGRKGPQRNIDQ